MTGGEEDAPKASNEIVELEEEFMWVIIDGWFINLKYDNEAEANWIFNEFMNFAGKGILQLTVLLYKLFWKND